MATMHPATIPAAPAVMRILSRFDREHLSAFMEVAVELLDALDSDLDLEPNGDELDGNGSEDDFMDHDFEHGYAAGCPIADGDCCPAGEDRGTEQGGGDDGLPGDPDDTEPNGDEGDYSDGDAGHCRHYGVDQGSAINERNPALV